MFGTKSNPTSFANLSIISAYLSCFILISPFLLCPNMKTNHLFCFIFAAFLYKLFNYDLAVCQYLLLYYNNNCFLCRYWEILLEV